MTMRQPKLEELIENPAAHFASPEAVTSDDRLTLTQKKQALQHWEEDARRLSVATEEGMSGGEPARLDEVLDAQSELPGKPVTTPTSPTKTG
jgi:hypothetical protein